MSALPNIALSDIADEIDVIEAELARRKLRVFVEKVWPIVEPAHKFVPNWHIDEICEVLEAVTRGEIKQLIINVPPGTMKSLLVSVIWPAWEWASFPSLKYLCASYGAALSVRDNIKVRDIVTSPWYQKHYGLRLIGDQNAKERFNTEQKGYRIATSVGGVGTGEHPDRIIIDDPHTAEQARSDAERQRALDWKDRTISSRGVARDCRVVLIMQRLHEEDLTGHLLAKGGWHHVCFPMKYDPKRHDPRDHRITEGELLWPRIFTPAKVRELEINLGPYGAAGQLQQSPAPEGGGQFREAWFSYVDVEPAAFAPAVRGWDTAGTEDDGDWTVGTKIKGPINGKFYVCHVLRGQWGPNDVDKNMRETAWQDGRACAIREEKEPGSSGKTVIAIRTKAFAGWDYKGVQIDKNKVTRAKPFRAQAEAGNVVLVRGTWNRAWLDELCIFPNGAHDDQVDSASCAFNELTGGPSAVEELEVEWG